MPQAKEDIVIFENPQRGIAPSPHLGFADIRNLDITSKPGSALLNFQLQRISAAPVNTTFTANAGTDVLTVGSTFQFNSHAGTKRAVTVSSSGTLPSPLVAGTVYFLIEVSSTTYKLATTLDNADGGTAIDITTAGSGTHTITSVDMGLPKHFAKDSRSGATFALDANGRLWEAVNSNDFYLITGNTLTNASGNGLAIAFNYVFVFRNAKVDVYGSLTSAHSSRAWTNDWQSLNTSAGTAQYHGALTGQDNIVYFADKNITTGVPYIGSIAEATTFDPATGSTYVFNNQADDLPSYKDITCLEELGTSVMVGTAGREIYPWDRNSETFGLPIIAAEDGISAMRTLNNILYFAAGSRGTLYATVGSSTKLIRRVPASITGAPNNSVNIGAIVGHKGKLFFTLECKTCSGVWSVDLDTGVLVLEHQISTGGYSTNNAYKLSALYSGGSEQLFVGWQDVDNSLYGIDCTYYSQYYYYPSYAGYADSKLVPVGVRNRRRSFTEIEIQLEKPLVSGQGVRVSYRKNLSDSFTVVGTFDYATYSYLADLQSLVLPASILDAEALQVRIEMTVSANATASPELIAVLAR